METSTLLVCPRGNPSRDQSTLRLEMAEIHSLEVRLQEVATANKETGPELSKTFIYGWKEASKYATWIEAELNSAKQHLATTRARISLDEAPELLQKRGLKVTADNVQYICDLSEEYQQAQDRLNQINAYRQFMEIKAKSFEMAYQSVKKIMGDNRPDYFARELNGSLNDRSNVGDSVGRNGEVTGIPGIGSAKYK